MNRDYFINPHQSEYPAINYLLAKGRKMPPVTRSSDFRKPGDIVIGEKAA